MDSIPQADKTNRVSQIRARLLRLHEAHATIGITALVAAPHAANINGALRGPACAYARTLPAEFPIRLAQLKNAVNANLIALAADIPDPCPWEPTHPYLYEGSWHVGDSTESQPLRIGLRSLRVIGTALRLNGQPFRFRGLSHQTLSEQRLRELHDLDCNLITCDSLGAADLTDQYGPFVATLLPDTFDAARQMAKSAGICRPSIGLWLTRQEWSSEQFSRLRAVDPDTPIALWSTDPTVTTPADLLVLDLAEPQLSKANFPTQRAWLAAVSVTESLAAIDADGFAALSRRLEDKTANLPGCMGWIAR